MQHKIGAIVEGKVTGITKFGAFVELEGGTVGMVHISEISSTYVSDISEHLKDQQKVSVKILNIGEDGKVSLSIKKAMPQSEQPVKRDFKPSPGGFNRSSSSNNGASSSGGFNRSSSGNNGGSSSSGGFNRNSGNNGGSSSGGFNKPSGGRSGGFKPSQSQSSRPATFDDMLSKFLLSSDEKHLDTRREKSSRRSTQKKNREYE